MNSIKIQGHVERICDYLAIRSRKGMGGEADLELEIEGKIDADSADGFQKHVMRAIHAGSTRLLLHMGRTDYISSMGIGALLLLRRTVEEKGGWIALAEVHPRVMEILRVMCLEKFFLCSE